MKYDLDKLKAAADIACEEAIACRDTFDHAAVNWGDFGCMSVEHWRNNDGDEGYRVCIEEADPSNTEVGNYIWSRLDKAGFRDVAVVFEW
jgi:hypothetical protein